MFGHNLVLVGRPTQIAISIRNLATFFGLILIQANEYSSKLESL